MKRLISFIICLFCAGQVFAAEQCTDVFPDGASTHSPGGNIFFDFNSRLIGSDDNQWFTQWTLTSTGQCTAGNINVTLVVDVML